jgi:hypothetical protein
MSRLLLPLSLLLLAGLPSSGRVDVQTSQAAAPEPAVETTGGPSRPATPREGTPIAAGAHPRLFFTAGDLPAIRDRIAKLYASEFQDFLDMLDNPGGLNKKVKRIEADWGILNYAFVAALDPADMKRRGFRFEAALDSPQEYCAASMTYLRTKLPLIAQAEDMGHGEMAAPLPTSLYLPVLAAYDWCYPSLEEADRRAIVDAFVSAYQTKRKGQDPLYFDGVEHMMANNQASADMHETLGIVAFYNDPYPDRALQAELMSLFDSIWNKRVLTELERFYGVGTGWHEGPTAYFKDGVINLGIPFAMFSPAFGMDYLGTMPFFVRYPEFIAANVRPHSLSKDCGGRCPPYLERWGTVGGGIDGIHCRATMLTAGWLRRHDHPNAALAKWAYQNLEAESCSTAVTDFGGPWAFGVLYSFLLGDKDVTPKSPAEMNVALAQEFGLGQHVMRTGYDKATDSLVVFWAPELKLYGHATPEVGSFTIHKFGNLILKPANSKSGDAKIKSSKQNIFTNTIGIEKSAKDHGLHFDGFARDPFFNTRKINAVKTAGSVIARALNGAGFDYVAYDSGPSWSTKTADLSQREFAYLRGPLDKEFVVVLDRVNTAKPELRKVWKAWIPAQPEFVNGTAETPRPGKWVGAGSDTVKVVNKAGDLRTKKYVSAPTHGALFLKVLQPSGAQLSVLGGPGYEFQSGLESGGMPWGTPPMTPAMHEYLGWGRIEITPATPQNFDVFLTVMQFGDAGSLTAMSAAVPVATADKGMLGTHVRDAANQWVVLFAERIARPGVAEARYEIEPVAGAPAKQLLVNMAPGRTFHVAARPNGARVSIELTGTSAPGSVAVTATDQGVVTFTLANGQIRAGS